MNTIYCRDRGGIRPFQLFKIITCSMCYYYMFPKAKVFRATPDFKMAVINGNYSETPDIENATAMSRLCGAIQDEDKCQQWQSCCEAALSCCKEQQKENNVTGDVASTPYCPRTWDGYSCWKDAPAKTRVSVKCPDYVHEFVTAESTAYKDCTGNGTWWRNPKTDMEWTNYSTCVDIEKKRTIAYVSIAFNLLSVLLLVPACLIFLYYRPLRMQHRIRLHLCLFVSFILTAIFHILWDILVYHDQFLQLPEHALINRNTVGCRFLYFMSRYSRNTNYFCMFVEGFYLYRLLAATFEKPKSLIGYYIFSWGFPLVPSLIYSTIRGTLYNERCWVRNAGPYEWILYVPNLMCIIGNLIFLFYILMVLVGQLQTHPNEPSNYRRTLKATFVLVPLFGLQLLFIIYRPPGDSAYAYTYEVLSKIIVNSQGALVALVFCFFNGEVHSHVRSTCDRMKKSPVRQPERSCSMSTQFTMASNRSSLPRNGHNRLTPTSGQMSRCVSGHNYIPLDTISNQDTSLVECKSPNSIY